jgi:hypothetical protein
MYWCCSKIPVHLKPYILLSKVVAAIPFRVMVSAVGRPPHAITILLFQTRLQLCHLTYYDGDKGWNKHICTLLHWLLHYSTSQKQFPTKAFILSTLFATNTAEKAHDLARWDRTGMLRFYFSPLYSLASWQRVSGRHSTSTFGEPLYQPRSGSSHSLSGTLFCRMPVPHLQLVILSTAVEPNNILLGGGGGGVIFSRHIVTSPCSIGTQLAVLQGV